MTPSRTTSALQSGMPPGKRWKRPAKAALDGFIRSLPKGYDTPVGELGGALSGGERQRIGVARAFLHDAPFLPLDEPTSNLDSLNEGVILKAVRAECKDKTVSWSPTESLPWRRQTSAFRWKAAA